MPFIRPCVLIAAACGLAFFSGPTSAEHAHAAVLVDGHGTRLATAATHWSNGTWRERRNATFRGRKKHHASASARSCIACAATEGIVRSLDPGPANSQITGERANRSQLQCPGMLAALGTRVSRKALLAAKQQQPSSSNGHALGRMLSELPEAWNTTTRRQRRARATAEAAAHAAVHSATEMSTNASDGTNGQHNNHGAAGSWLGACGLAHRNSQWTSRASIRGHAPLVFVYGFMERLHAELLKQESSHTFFDPWHQHNQFLSEWAFHRSLLSSALITRDPSKATFFFVPFYSRMAWENRPMQAKMLAALKAGLSSSPYWRRSRGRDHLFVVSSTRAMEQLYKSALPLVSPSILLKVELGDTRRKSDRRQPNHVAIPYYVPWLPRDESTKISNKRFSVCLESSSWSGNGKVAKHRSRLAATLRGYPDAVVRSVDPHAQTRSLLCGSRRRMRACKFCLIPRGITPSSRRLYEALAAKCVPVLLSDRFVVPFEGSTLAGGGLLPPHALDSFVLRVEEDSIPQLPRLLNGAMKKHKTMHQALLAYRTAYLYELPLDGHPAAGGAVCAVIAEVARRFGPHLSAWRSAEANGNAAADLAVSRALGY